MARPQAEKVGAGPCPECGQSLMFRRSAGGLLSHKCDYCDSSGFALPGGSAFKKRMAGLTPIAAAVQEVIHQVKSDDQVKLEPASAAPVTKKKPVNSVFSLDQL